MGELLRHGRVRRPSLGLAAQNTPLSQRIIRHFELPVVSGVHSMETQARRPRRARSGSGGCDRTIQQ